MEGPLLWHSVAFANDDSGDFGRPTVEIACEGRKAATPTLHKGMFAWKGREVVPEVLQRAMEVEHPSEGHILSSLCTEASLATDGDRNLVSKSWLSLLVPVGTLYQNMTLKRTGVCIASTEAGVLRFNCGATNVNANYRMDFPKPAADPIAYDVVTDYTKSKCAHLDLKLPGEPVGGFSQVEGHAVAVCSMKGSQNALTFSVLHGLKGLTTMHMESLYVLSGLNVRGKLRPDTEGALFKAIAMAVLGEDYTDELLKKLLELRHCDLGPEVEKLVLSSPLRCGDAEHALDEDIEYCEMADELKEARKMWSKSKAASLAKVAKAAAEAGVKSKPSSSSSAPSSSSGVDPDRKKPIFRNPWASITKEMAERYCPPGAKISLQREWHSRWRVSAPYRKKTSKVFEKDDPEDELASLTAVLRPIWAKHCEMSGSSCPWILD